MQFESRQFYSAVVFSHYKISQSITSELQVPSSIVCHTSLFIIIDN